MVGFVTLWNPTSSNQTAYGVGGIFDMHGSTDFAAASGSTPRLEYGQYGSAPYSYDMILNVKQNTYGNYVDYDSGTAELLDETTHNEKSYAPGVVGDYVVDFHPAAQSDAAEAKSISTGITGVFGLEVEEGTQMYRLIHNTTSSPVTYTAALPSSMWGSNSVTVHSAEVPAVNGSTVNNIPSEPEIVGETYRPAWMDPNGSDSWSPALPVNLSLAGGTVSVTVPPNSHILLMSDTSTLLASWINTDIGDAAVPGSSSYSNGTYTLQGSGSDIWDAIDGFQYDYQGLNGNGAIVAHLASLSTGKAGVMIRETLSGDSSYVDMVINSKQAKFEYRAGTGNNARSGASSAVENVPAWLKLVRSGNTFTGYYGPDGINWTEMGTGITDTMNASLSLGLVETSQNNSTLGTATFDNVNILPDGTWAAQDIGSVAIAGYSRYNQSVVTMSGEGADIYGGADAFHYEYQTLSGNGTITARVTGVQNTNNAAKVGVMIRETLNPGATNAFMLISAENGINSQWRSTTNGGTSQGTGVSGISTPYWLRVSRSGNTFTMSYSSNGTTWTTSSTPTITMATNAYIGLAVCSHNTAEACMATVDNITTSN
jgi:regulation of enolase protein 1 (concanavalin A-like superfamily)